MRAGWEFWRTGGANENEDVGGGTKRGGGNIGGSTRGGRGGGDGTDGGETKNAIVRALTA